MKQGNHDVTTCQRISEMLARVGDKWTLLVIRELGRAPTRFNALQRQIGDISQKMLSTTLRNLERDGLVSRTVTPTTPPQVEYALTQLGHDFFPVVTGIAEWTVTNMSCIEDARRAYDTRLAIAAE
jgi:DNA-binding HxlR family transcriptional regulator